ncbi:hypothetical protein MHY87_13705 [Microvirga sp. ACRRW]|uniref:hypothetical protein n=1 Tax=Microvirga sp. ACRRW TaxID=2918205 RepID=UPI001EF6F5FE|nr:hypothetical protein [Microvirga sp. ACRRW]MCG7393961.1 hypothetical protein [Microvirga sp. ACRRW]
MRWVPERWVRERSAAAGLPEVREAFWAAPVPDAAHRSGAARQVQFSAGRVQAALQVAPPGVPQGGRAHREPAGADALPGVDRAPEHWGAEAALALERRGVRDAQGSPEIEVVVREFDLAVLEQAARRAPSVGAVPDAVPEPDAGLRVLLAQGSGEAPRVGLPVRHPVHRHRVGDVDRLRRLRGGLDGAADRERLLHPVRQASVAPLGAAQVLLGPR